jgi:hypothetical protein
VLSRVNGRTDGTQVSTQQINFTWLGASDLEGAADAQFVRIDQCYRTRVSSEKCPYHLTNISIEWIPVSGEIWRQRTWTTVCGKPHASQEFRMNAALRPRTQTFERPLSFPPQKPAYAPTASRGDVVSTIEFAAIESAYARHGGVLRADDVVQQMRGHWEQPISVLSRWIVSHAMITIDWRSDILVPMFQIDPCSRTLRPGCREIVAELKDVMGDWEMARWFATSDPLLGGLTPVDMLEASWPEVFHAARMARFIARG